MAEESPRLQRSIALIRRLDPSGARWLVRWNPRSNWFEFVATEPLEQESFRESIDRDVAWALGLDRDRDFLVSQTAQLNLECVEQLPGWPAPVPLCVRFYVVEPYGSAAWQRIREDPSNRWVTAAELHAGRTADGRPIDPLLVALLRRSEVIQPWE